MPAGLKIAGGWRSRRLRVAQEKIWADGEGKETELQRVGVGEEDRPCGRAWGRRRRRRACRHRGGEPVLVYFFLQFEGRTKTVTDEFTGKLE